MTKFIDEVLSEIVGVSCGNIKFSLEVPSNYYADGYSHGFQYATIEFTTREAIKEDRIGSLVLVCHRNYEYSAVLLFGKETARIAQAVADGLAYKE